MSSTGAPADPLPGRLYLALLLAVTVLGFGLRLSGVGEVPATDDDLGVASAAVDYMERGHFGVVMFHHPKLRNVLVYAARLAGRGDVLELRLVSLVLGGLLVPLLVLAARRLLRSQVAALLAGLFLALDPLHVDFSRQAVQEVYMPFFAVLGVYLAHRFSEGAGPAALVGAGLGFGLGVASKSYVLMPLGVTALAVAWSRWRAAGRSRAARAADLALTGAALGLLPALVFLLCYLPWFLHQGFTLGEWVQVQRLLFQEALTHGGFEAYGLELDTQPSHWFIKPVGFADFVFDQGRPWVLLAIPNPLVWLLTLPSVAFLAARAWRERDHGRLLVVALFAVPYLPLVLSSRPIWVHTAFAVLPFALMAVAWSVTEVLYRPGPPRRGFWAYLAAVALVTVPLYLLAVGRSEQLPFLRPVLEAYRPSTER